MEWTKQGRIFAVSGSRNWACSHASVPVARAVGGALWRVYFSSRDEMNRSHVGFFELDADDLVVLDRAENPILGPGEPGTFDDAGAMATDILDHEGATYLYYVGWNRAESVPFRNAIGLGVSRDGGRTFRKLAKGPILDRGIHDPGFVASCCVLVDRGVWRMWYLSCVGWERMSGGLRHRYHIKYAESDDGIEWRRPGRVCIDFKDENEFAISRPFVLRDGGLYRMWYSYRGSSYRIGYAESADGLVWRRLDERVGIDVSPGGWDSEMIEYPWVFDHGDRRFMLYNGNGYGASGIGLAELVES